MPVLRISKTTAERLIFSGRPEEYFDTRLTGFGVRVNQNSKTYFVQGKISRADGKRIKFNAKIGRVGIVSFDYAHQEAKRILEEAAGGVTPKQAKQELARQLARDSKRDITVKEVYEAYIAARRLKDSTKKEYRELLEHNLSEWMEMPIRSITSAMVLVKHAEIGKRSPSRADGVMRVLRALCQYVVDTYEDLDIMSRNPVRKLSATKCWYRPGRKTRYIRAGDLPAWFAAVLQEGELFRMYFLVLIFTGCRFQEGASVRVGDFNFRTGLVVFRDTKGGLPLEVPVSSYLLPRIEAYIYRNGLRGDDFLFPSVGNKKSESGHIENVSNVCERIATASGVEFSPHDLRRTFLSYCSSLRVPKLLQKRLVGHAIPSDVTDGYVQIPMEDLEQVVEEITSYILKAAKQA